VIGWKDSSEDACSWKEIISIKPRPKSTYDFFGLVYCFVVCLFCPPALHNINTPIAQYSQFVLKVPLNTSQPAIFPYNFTRLSWPFCFQQLFSHLCSLKVWPAQKNLLRFSLLSFHIMFIPLFIRRTAGCACLKGSENGCACCCFC